MHQSVVVAVPGPLPGEGLPALLALAGVFLIVYAIRHRARGAIRNPPDREFHAAP